MKKKTLLPTAEPTRWRERWNEPLHWPTPPAARVDLRKTLAEHRAFRPSLAESALVLIDVDKKAFDRQIATMTRHDARDGHALIERTYQVVVPNLIRLVRHFRQQHRPVIYVQWGWHRYQYPPLEPQPGDDVVIKHGRGAFGTSGLDALLRRRKVTTCLFAGADTALCVASTVRGAIDHGYRAVLVEDACVSCLDRLHTSTIETLGWMQAHILPTRDVLKLSAKRA